MHRSSPALAAVVLLVAALPALARLPRGPGLPDTTTTTADTATTTTDTTTATPAPPPPTSTTVAPPTTTTQVAVTTTTAAPVTSTTRRRASTTTTGTQPASTTTTTTTIPVVPFATTTTTTLPAGPEVCGNCVDDDRNGFVDFADPACCAGGTSAMTLRRARVVRRGPIRWSVRIDAVIASATGIDPLVQDVFVALRPAHGAPLFCAWLPADRFDASGRAVLFHDRRHTVAGAVGVDRLRAVVRPDGGLAIHIEGNRMAFAPPGEHLMRLTLGFRFPATGEQTNHCGTVTALLRANAAGTRLVFP